MGSFISLSYDASSGAFEASGFTTDYASGSVTLQGAGSYTLSAIITQSGVLTSGTLTIDGDIGFGTTNLLTGNLSAIGFDNNGGDIFEFRFTVTEGDSIVVNDFGGVGVSDGGVILTAWFGEGDVPFTGSWTSNFSNSGTGSGVADSTLVVVPEPSSISLLLVGSLVCVVARLRCRRHD